MVVSIGKIGVAHADYYTGRATGSEGYYTDSGERPGRWIAAGAMSVTAGSEVTRDDLRAVLSCVDPATGEQLGRKYETSGRYSDALGVRRRRKAMSAYDLTYSVPKSVSVAWALAGDETRAEIEAAFDASVAAVVGRHSKTTLLSSRSIVSKAASNASDSIPATSSVSQPAAVASSAWVIPSTSRAVTSRPAPRRQLTARQRPAARGTSWTTGA